MTCSLGKLPRSLNNSSSDLPCSSSMTMNTLPLSSSPSSSTATMSGCSTRLRRSLRPESAAGCWGGRRTPGAESSPPRHDRCGAGRRKPSPSHPLRRSIPAPTGHRPCARSGLRRPVAGCSQRGRPSSLVWALLPRCPPLPYPLGRDALAISDMADNSSSDPATLPETQSVPASSLRTQESIGLIVLWAPGEAGLLGAWLPVANEPRIFGAAARSVPIRCRACSPSNKAPGPTCCSVRSAARHCRVCSSSCASSRPAARPEEPWPL